MQKPLRILIVADVHHRPVDAPPKLCSHGLGLLEPVISQTMSREYDLLIDLGDRIEDLGPEEDLHLAKDIAGLFKQARVPRAHLMGNHDSYFVTAGQWSDILEVEIGSRVLEIGGYRLVLFCPDVNNERGRYDYSLKPAELEWLSGALQSPLPTVIFSHVPLLAGPLFGNYYFEGKRGRAEFLNAADARAMVSDSNAVLSVSGHVHWNTWHSVDGVHYVTLQSLTESFTTHPHPSGAYTILELGEDVSINVGGLDRMQLRLKPRKSQRQWLKRP